jgi:DNA modification methylase
MQLINGDCLEEMKSIPDGSVDAIICDPPYGTTACKWDSVIPFDKMWEQLNRIIKPNGAKVLFGAEPFSSSLRMSNLKEYKYDWVWDKVLHSNPLISKIQPLSAHELISVFYAKQPTYNPQMSFDGKEIKRGGPTEGVSGTKGSATLTRGKDSTKARYPKRIIEFSNANKTGVVHPTQKPVALMEYLIKTYTNEGETVLDFTMGSGTTGVACVNTGRNFIGIEQDEKYFKIAEERIELPTSGHSKKKYTWYNPDIFKEPK